MYVRDICCGNCGSEISIEKEEETMAVKNGLLYLLFGTYCDLFLKLSVVSGVINIGVKFF